MRNDRRRQAVRQSRVMWTRIGNSRLLVIATEIRPTFIGISRLEGVGRFGGLLPPEVGGGPWKRNFKAFTAHAEPKWMTLPLCKLLRPKFDRRLSEFRVWMGVDCFGVLLRRDEGGSMRMWNDRRR